MGKIRNKKKSKQNIASNPLQSVNISLPENMSAEDLQHTIARAIIEADEIRLQQEKIRKEQEQQEWCKLIGYKDYSKTHCKFRAFKSLGNKLYAIFKICMLPKSAIKGDRATIAILKMVLLELLIIFRFIFSFAALSFLLYIPLQYVFSCPNKQPWYISGLFAILAVCLFFIGRVLKITSVEIDKLDDRNYLLGLFASITSLVSIIIAVIAIVKEA